MKTSRHLNPQLLATFIAIADTGSFLNAARLVGRTEAAISLQMRRLEEAVGDPALFERIGRKKVLTERGEVFLAHARTMLLAERSVIRMISQTEDPSPLRLGAPDDYSAFLPGIIGTFTDLHPEAKLEIHSQSSGTLNDMIVRGALDLAIVTRHPDDQTAESLRQEPLVWVASRASLALQRDRVPLATFQPGCLTRRLSIEALAKAGRAFEIVFSSPSLSGLLQPVKCGAAIAAMARCSVPNDLIIVGEDEGLPQLPSLDLALRRADIPVRPTLSDSLVGVIRDAMVDVRLWAPSPA